MIARMQEIFAEDPAIDVEDPPEPGEGSQPQGYGG